MARSYDLSVPFEGETMLHPALVFVILAAGSPAVAPQGRLPVDNEAARVLEEFSSHPGMYTQGCSARIWTKTF